MKNLRIVVVLALIIPLMACSGWNFLSKNKEEYNPYEGVSAKELYEESKKAIAKKKFTEATKRLEAMETMYPFSEYAEAAELDLIHAYYEMEDFPSTSATADRFIHLYPRSNRVDYAYYMKGLANFRQLRGVYAQIFPMDESWRDPGTQLIAYSDFATLIQKFPSSKYKANALQRMIYLRNMFAQRELHIANYYFERKMYVAAIERAGEVLRNYPQAPSAEKALVVLWHANKALGLDRASDEAAKVYYDTYHRAIA